MLLNLSSLEGAAGGTADRGGNAAHTPNCLISARSWERTDRPQPVYTGALSLWEAPFYVPIGAQTQSGGRTPDRLTDRAYVLQTWPEWIVTVPSGTTTAQLWPGILQGTGLSYRSGDRAGLDVRRTDPPVFSWAQPVVDATVATWAPIFNAELETFRTGNAASLDSRFFDWNHESPWLVPNFVTVTQAQLWPAILEGLGLSYRTLDRADVDVRGTSWQPDSAWITTAVPIPATVAQLWPAILAGLGTNYRTDDRGRLQVQLFDWGTGQSSWITPNLPVVPSSAGLRIILVDGRLAIRLSGFLYEWLE